MPDITISDIRLKRGSGAPGSLNSGEPAHDQANDVLRIGKASGMSTFRDQTYVDTGDAATLAASEAYTDAAIATVGTGTGLNDYGTF